MRNPDEFHYITLSNGEVIDRPTTREHIVYAMTAMEWLEEKMSKAASLIQQHGGFDFPYKAHRYHYDHFDDFNFGTGKFYMTFTGWFGDSSDDHTVEADIAWLDEEHGEALIKEHFRERQEKHFAAIKEKEEQELRQKEASERKLLAELQAKYDKK